MRLRPAFELEIGGRKIQLGRRTLIMGVLNVTPDSFFDGGLYLDPGHAIARGLEMARQGADWVDVGGESTRPGARPVPVEEELRRVLPVIRGLRKRLPSLPISVDTTKAEVAEEAVRAGATVLNDVSGLRFDQRLADVARRYFTPLVLMHLRGRPATMQQAPFARSIWHSLGQGFGSSIRRAMARGVHRSQLIIDPGIGFGKSRRQNFEILAHLERLRRFRLPLMVGTSRKSSVQAIVAGEGLEPSKRGEPGKRRWLITGKGSPQEPSRQRLPALDLGDAAAVVAAILGGAHIVRVHDPAAMLPAVRVADAVLASIAPHTTLTPPRQGRKGKGW